MSRLVDAAYALAKTGSFAKEGRSMRPMQAKAYNEAHATAATW